jgi:hypothetical protein
MVRKMECSKGFAKLTLLILFAATLVALPKQVHACANACSNFTPQQCLNTVTGQPGQSSIFGQFINNVGVAITIGTFSTQNVPDVRQLDCGSRDVGLNDLVSQFSVSINGLYRISTINLNAGTGGDTTLQINQCDGKSIACNDDVSASVSYLYTFSPKPVRLTRWIQ